MADNDKNKPADNDNASNKPVRLDVQVGPRTWRQRGEVVGLGMLGTAAGIGLVEAGKRALVKKATDEGLRHAASFAGDMFKSLFG